jgi:D-arabinose 1-dehydrogenase-like Zn-dependent alcohol dehydrogenase
MHTVTDGWGDIPLPTFVGHEIIGISKRVCSEVKSGIKVGERVARGRRRVDCELQEFMLC